MLHVQLWLAAASDNLQSRFLLCAYHVTRVLGGTPKRSMHNVKAMTMEHAVTTGGQQRVTKARASHVVSVAGAQQPHGQVCAHDPQSEGSGEESPGLQAPQSHLLLLWSLAGLSARPGVRGCRTSSTGHAVLWSTNFHMNLQALASLSRVVPNRHENT